MSQDNGPTTRQLQDNYKEILQRTLEEKYVPHLPPLLDPANRQQALDLPERETPENQRKNISRAFGAFVLAHLCNIPAEEAAQAVTDDYDDFGIDVLYYHSPSSTVYIIQTKFKSSEAFRESDALSLCNGIRQLVNLNLDGFNRNFRDRVVDIEGTLDQCNHIQVVIAHIGSGITDGAKNAIKSVLQEQISSHEERLKPAFIDYDAERTKNDMLFAQSFPKLDEQLYLLQYTKVAQPRQTAFGLVHISDLVSLYEQYGNRLFAKNLRYFLGYKSGVNQAIRNSLLETPKDFLYLNNGITIICEEFQPKASRQGKKRIELTGLSVINGAQTVTAAADLVRQNPNCDISEALVSVTVIQTGTNVDFGEKVTYARNYQNQVNSSDFVALDPEQERLRREIAYLDIRYIYKTDHTLDLSAPDVITVFEAAYALAALDNDPRIAVTAQHNPGTLLDVESEEYKRIFGTSPMAFKVVNAVRVYRYVKQQLGNAEKAATAKEKLVYRHGVNVSAWILVKRISKEIVSSSLLDESRLETSLGTIMDNLRQTLFDELALSGKGPRAAFRSQTETIPIMEKIMLKEYGLSGDTTIPHVRSRQTPGKWGPHDRADPYPIALFDYMINNAPQIGL